MDSKKTVYAGLFLLMVLLLVGFVSAGFLDRLFGREPWLSPFNATVTLQSLPPTIPKVFNVSDEYGSSLVDSVLPTADGTSDVNIVFLAEDPNTNNDLPVGVLTIGANVDVFIHYGGSIPSTAANFPYIAGAGDSCSELGGTGPNGACNSCNGTQRIYFCSLTDSMQFYHEPNLNSPTLPNLWIVNITIRDVGGSAGKNDTKNFTYLQLPAIQNIVNLSWVGISPSLANQKATDNVTIINKGNQLLANVNITAFNLTGASYPGSPRAHIPASAIRSHGNSTTGFECGSPPATTFIHGAGLNVSGFNLSFGPSVSTQLRFCIYPILNTFEGGTLDLGDPAYIAAGGRAGTADWRLQY